MFILVTDGTTAVRVLAQLRKSAQLFVVPATLGRATNNIIVESELFRRLASKHFRIVFLKLIVKHAIFNSAAQNVHHFSL